MDPHRGLREVAQLAGGTCRCVTNAFTALSARRASHKKLTAARRFIYAHDVEFAQSAVGGAAIVFYHLVLGCLRDGKPRHGYDVCGELRARSGLQVNPGNVYRELSDRKSTRLNSSH